MMTKTEFSKTYLKMAFDAIKNGRFDTILEDITKKIEYIMIDFEDNADNNIGLANTIINDDKLQKKLVQAVIAQLANRYTEIN